MNEQSECGVCGGALWVCGDHVDKPWGGASNREDACHGGGAGAPCLVSQSERPRASAEDAGGLQDDVRQESLEALTSTDTDGSQGCLS